MSTSRFLKKREEREDVEDETFRVPLPRSKAARSKPDLEVREASAKEGPKPDAHDQLWKLKDEDFTFRLNKKLDLLTKSLSTSSSSASSEQASKAELKAEKHLRDSESPQRQPTRTKYVLVDDLDRPRGSPDRGKGGSSRDDRTVRKFLMDRKIASGSDPEGNDSDTIQSLWAMVQSTGAKEHDTSTVYHHEHPRATAKEELAEFSFNVGRYLPPAEREHEIEGDDFWSRLATCKEEFRSTELLVNRTFNTGRHF